MEEIAIIGASGHAKVIFDIIKKQRKYKVIAFLEVDLGLIQKEYFGIRILDEHLFPFRQFSNVVLALGDNYKRFVVFQKLIKSYPHLSYPCLVHPSAQIGENVLIGHGSVVMANSVINADSFVGDFCIVNTSASIDHDCTLQNFSSIAPGAVLGGSVVLGEFSAVGIGASISHGVEIGYDTVVGAGAVIVTDIPNEIVCYGVPAREIRKRSRGEKYLN